MCNCENIKVGSYENQVELPAPDHLIRWSKKVGFSLGGERNTVCVDKCLEQEIKELWRWGIITTGCCCGHNIVEPYIGVDASDVGMMEVVLCYDRIGINSFKPQTI